MRHSEERFRSAFEQAPVGLCLLSPAGRFVKANAALCQMLGYSESELLSLTVRDLTHPDDLTVTDEWLRQLLPGETAAASEQRYLHKAGHVVWGMVRASLLSDAGSSPRLFITHIQDITERKRTEEEHKVLFEIAQDVTGALDLNGILRRVQRRTATVLPCDGIITYNWDAAQNVFRALAWYGIPAELVPNTIALEFRSGQSVVERLLAGETLLINDVANERWVPTEVLTRFQLAAVLLVPLLVRGRIVGALAALNAESGRRFDAHQVRVLERIGQHVGVAIEAADLYRAQEEDAAVSGALTRVGQELMSAVGSRALLDRLCRLTTEVLGCDHSHTFLWQSQAFVAVAGYGDSPEQWEMIRRVKLGRPPLAAQLDEMEREGIFVAKISDLPGSEAAAGARAYGTSVGLMVPLRRDNELLGFHTAGYRGGREVFDARQEHIARGLARLGSLALENARLIEELDGANRLKSDFVGTMSHEFRTPLSVIIGYTDLMLEGAFGDLTPAQVGTVQRVQKSSLEMIELANATLDLSRLEAGRMPLDITDVGLADLLREVDGETRHLQEKSGLSFLLKIPPDLQVRTDRTKLKLVVKNLIGNAIKFTKQGSVIVEACPRDDGIEIAVSDTGIGIAPDALPIIFEPFRQADGHGTKQYDGVGLGLHIARRFLQALGGSISVESEVGCGSTFRVRLPVSGNVE